VQKAEEPSSSYVSRAAAKHWTGLDENWQPLESREVEILAGVGRREDRVEGKARDSDRDGDGDGAQRNSLGAWVWEPKSRWPKRMREIWEVGWLLAESYKFIMRMCSWLRRSRAVSRPDRGVTFESDAGNQHGTLNLQS
jgi:hypothetical protein